MSQHVALHMPKRRLQCGQCSTVIKVSSRIYRPVCPRCQTAHTFIKCGRAECGTLMCLPENVNQFSCPRCNVQLARPGLAQLKSNPIAVRCGNMSCDFLMTIPGNVGRFRCPRCQMEQVLPGTEEALKCKARYEEEMRQKALLLKYQEELRGLCEIFHTLEPNIVEAVYETADKQRSIALQQLMEMAGDTPELCQSLRKEAARMHAELLEKRNLVEDSIRCPISRKPMKDPVLASDGHSYERGAITDWLKTKSKSPVTGEEMDKSTLVPNHQLRSEMESWLESKSDAGSAQCLDADAYTESVIPAVSSRPTTAVCRDAVVMEAKSVSPQGMIQALSEDMDAGAPPHPNASQGAVRTSSQSSSGIVASMVRALADMKTSGGSAAGGNAKSS